MSITPTISSPTRYQYAQVTALILGGTNQESATSLKLPNHKVYSVNNRIEASNAADDIFKPCSDGERTGQLTRIIGKLLSQGLDIELIKQIVLNWNLQNTPPLPEEKVVGTCKSILLTHQRNHGEQSNTAEYEVLAPLFNVTECSIAHYLDTAPPARTWLIVNFLPFGKTGMIVATGGTGKTQLLIQLAISVATGIKFCGSYDVGKIGVVVMLLAEEDDDEIHTRVYNTANQMLVGAEASKYNDLLKKNLLVKSMVSENNLMTSSNKLGEVSRTDYSARLIKALENIDNIALIVIDPAARFRGGNENSAEDGTRFVEELEYIRKHTGATVLVAHHTNKYSSSSEEPNQNASRGSSALTDGMRWQMNLAALSKAECVTYAIAEADRRRYLKASVTKNNYGPPLDPILLIRGENGYLAPVASGSPRFTRDEADTLTILRKLKSLHPKTMSATDFTKNYAGRDKPLRIADNRMRELIKSARTSGKLGTLKSKLIITQIGENLISENASVTTENDNKMHPRAKLSSQQSILKSNT